MSAVPVAARVTVDELREDIEAGALPRRHLRVANVIDRYGVHKSTAQRLLDRATEAGVIRRADRTRTGGPNAAQCWRLR